MTPERWQQVERIYYAALAADVTARPALLDEACAGDDALRLWDDLQELLKNSFFLALRRVQSGPPRPQFPLRPEEQGVARN